VKIGIIVYSETGNTLLCAEKIREALTLAGGGEKGKEKGKVEVEVWLERLQVTGNPRVEKEISFPSLPDISSADALVFASPVHAFSAAPAMKKYLEQLPADALKGKKAACLVTQMFPYAWLGGNRSVGQMAALSRKKGADMRATAVINWRNKRRQEMIEEAAARVSRALL